MNSSSGGEGAFLFLFILALAGLFLLYQYGGTWLNMLFRGGRRAADMSLTGTVLRWKSAADPEHMYAQVANALADLPSQPILGSGYKTDTADGKIGVEIGNKMATHATAYFFASDFEGEAGFVFHFDEWLISDGIVEAAKQMEMLRQLISKVVLSVDPNAQLEEINVND